MENVESECELKTILVAEDNDSNFLLVKSILKKHYNVVRAHNGQEAVRLSKEDKYWAILMDMKMPIKDGIEATKEIREFNTEIPIIALTANAFDSDKDLALSAGCDCFLTKPINKSVLIEALENAYQK